MYLPNEILGKVMLFNESKEAKIIKKYWADLDDSIDIYTDLICYPMYVTDVAGNDIECGYYSEVIQLDYPRRHFLPIFS